MSALDKGGGTIEAETEAEPGPTRFDFGPELDSSPAGTVGLRSGWSRPSPEIDASPGGLARGPQGGRSVVRKPSRAFPQVPGEGPRPRPPTRPGSALWDQSRPNQKWTLHRGHWPVIRPGLGLPSGPDCYEAPGRPPAH